MELCDGSHDVQSVLKGYASQPDFNVRKITLAGARRTYRAP
jgi:hypothetical protein